MTHTVFDNLSVLVLLLPWVPDVLDEVRLDQPPRKTSKNQNMSQ